MLFNFCFDNRDLADCADNTRSSLVGRGWLRQLQRAVVDHRQLKRVRVGLLRDAIPLITLLNTVPRVVEVLSYHGKGIPIVEDVVALIGGDDEDGMVFLGFGPAEREAQVFRIGAGLQELGTFGERVVLAIALQAGRGPVFEFLIEVEVGSIVRSTIDFELNLFSECIRNRHNLTIT